METMFCKRGGKSLPHLHMATTTTFETSAQIQRWKDTFSPIVDYISTGITIMDHFHIDEINKDEKKQRYAAAKDKQLIQRHEFPHYASCPEVFDKLNILWNGDITPCCADYEGEMVVGNIMNSTLKDIWNQDTLYKYRQELAWNRFDNIPLCRQCIDYMFVAQG